MLQPEFVQDLSGGLRSVLRNVFEPLADALSCIGLRGKVEQDHELGYQLMKRFAANLIDRLQATRMQLLDVYGQVGV